MAKRVTVTEFVRGFADYINRVAYQGERLVLVRGQRELAEVSPRPAERSLRELPGLLSRLPRLSGDDATSFDADIANARAELGAAHEPEWPS
jgi:hypothetical protein